MESKRLNEMKLRQRLAESRFEGKERGVLKRLGGNKSSGE